MIILDKPYVSDYLKGRIAAKRIPVLDTPAARAALGDSPNLMGRDEFVARVRDGHAPRLYANSENAIGWVAENLRFCGLPDLVDRCKDKERFRELVRPMFPDYRFEGVDFDDLDAVDPSLFAKPFIIKPAVGFFSLGVHKVDDDAQWPETVTAIRAEVGGIHSQYPDQVLDTGRFIIEENIPGEEYAVDVYWNAEGEAVILNVLHHSFPDENNVADRVYVTSPAIVREHGERFRALLEEMGRLAGIRNFPAHVELRLDEAGNIGFIEANPLRFAGWCVADMTWHAWGYDPYTTYLNGERPDWEALCAAREGTVTSVVIADVASDVDPADVADVDYAALRERFSDPLEIRRIDWKEYPVFAFVFARHKEGETEELDEMLRSDLKEYLRMA